MEEASPNKHYSYVFSGGAHNVFRFLTDDAIAYEVKFVPSSEFFQDYQELDADVFEMIISVADNPGGGRLRADTRVSPTVFRIFETFFLAQRHIIVFICDSSDGRERARFRKFDAWFYANVKRSADIAKIDRTIPDGDVVIFISLLVSRRHPQLKPIVDMFVWLGDEEK